MPQIIERHKFREDFLDAFVRTLILNSYDAEKAKKEKPEQTEKATEEQTTPAVQMLPSMMHEKQTKKKSFPVPKPLTPRIPQKRTPAPTASPIPLPQLPQLPQLKPGQKPETINLGRIAMLLKDPSVFSVECPGPGKNLLVNRGGALQATPVILSEEAIGNLMQNFSEKTRIPLISGVFRAAYQDLVISAVVSDFVGTRFLIQKRTPFQKY